MAKPARLAQTIEQANLQDAQALCKWLVEDNGYLAAKVLPDGSVAGLLNLIFTRAICLGCHWEGWANRFCFEDLELANSRFESLVSEDDLPAGHIASRVGHAMPLRRPGMHHAADGA